jgi:two-component system, chemotaxis family, protein-glutamate methylesterase/glutaminase
VSKKIKVVVLDDSAVMRHLLSEIINAESDMEAVGGASDPLVARDMIKSLRPDVITLDMEMPRMDGLEFLEKLMRLRPIPVVMVSAFAEANSQVALRALELGAMELVAKPKNSASGLADYAHEVTAKIRAAAVGRLKKPATASVERSRLKGSAVVFARSVWADRIIVIGASTGGTEAVKDVLVQMPPNSPPILVAQHMPEGFTKSFAARLDSLCAIHVKEADDGERAQPGHAYIAPGHSHLMLKRSGGIYSNVLSKAEPVNRHRPSVDVLFRSAARSAGAHVLGVILTGMGKDGAAGMAEMHRAGAHTYAQDEASCVVFGMPKEAIAHGGVDEILPLDEIATAVLARLSTPVAAKH